MNLPIRSKSDRKYIIGQKMYIVQERQFKPQLYKRKYKQSIPGDPQQQQQQSFSNPNQHTTQQNNLIDSRTYNSIYDQSIILNNNSPKRPQSSNIYNNNNNNSKQQQDEIVIKQERSRRLIQYPNSKQEDSIQKVFITEQQQQHQNNSNNKKSSKLIHYKHKQSLPQLSNINPQLNIPHKKLLKNTSTINQQQHKIQQQQYQQQEQQQYSTPQKSFFQGKNNIKLSQSIVISQNSPLKKTKTQNSPLKQQKNSLLSFQKQRSSKQHQNSPLKKSDSVYQQQNSRQNGYNRSNYSRGKTLMVSSHQSYQASIQSETEMSQLSVHESSFYNKNPQLLEHSAGPQQYQMVRKQSSFMGGSLQQFSQEPNAFKQQKNFKHRLSIPKFSFHHTPEEPMEELDGQLTGKHEFKNFDYEVKFTERQTIAPSKFDRLLQRQQFIQANEVKKNLQIKRNLKKIFIKKPNIYKIWQKSVLTNLIRLGLCERKTSLFFLSQHNKAINNFKHFILQTIERCKTPKSATRKRQRTKNYVYDLDISYLQNNSMKNSIDINGEDQILELRSQKSVSRSGKSPKKSPLRSPGISKNYSSFKNTPSSGSQQNSERNSNQDKKSSSRKDLGGNNDEEDDDEDEEEEDEEEEESSEISDSDIDSDDDDSDDFFFEEEEDDVGGAQNSEKMRQLAAIAQKAGIAVETEEEKKKKDDVVPKEMRKQVIFSNSLLKWGMFDILILFYDKKCILEFQQTVVLTMNIDHLQALIDIIAYLYEKMNIKMSQLAAAPFQSPYVHETNQQKCQKMLYYMEYTVQKIIDYLNHCTKLSQVNFITQYIMSVNLQMFQGDLTHHQIIDYIEQCEHIRNIIDFQEQNDDRQDQNKKHNNQLIPETLQMYEDNNSQLVLIDTIGAGAFGQVNCYYDLEKKQYSAIKKFVRKEDFDREYSLYEYIKQLEINNIFLDQIGVSEQEQYIIMRRGQVDFQKFIELRNEAGIEFSQIEIIYVFNRLLQLINALHKKELIFSDLKPENVILDFDQDRCNYHLYLIDIGSIFIENIDQAPEKLKEQHMFGTSMLTKWYFPPIFLQKFCQLSTVQCDLYTLGRSIQTFLNPNNIDNLNDNDLIYKDNISPQEFLKFSSEKRQEHELKVFNIKKEFHDRQIMRFIERYKPQTGPQLARIIQKLLIDNLEEGADFTAESLFNECQKLYTPKNVKQQYLVDKTNLVRNYLEELNKKKSITSLNEYELYQQLQFFEQNNLYQKQLQILTALEKKLREKKIESHKSSNFAQIKEIQNENRKRQTQLIICQNKLGKVYNYLGKYNEAFSFFEKSLHNSEKIFAQNTIIHQMYMSSKRFLGLINRKRGLLNQAITQFEACQELLKEANYPKELEINMSLILNNSIAKVYLEQQNVDSSLKLLQKTLDLVEATKNSNKKQKKQIVIDEKNIAYCCSLLGQAYYKKEDWDMAEMYHQQSLNVNKKERNKYYAKDLNNLAMICRQKKNFEKMEKNIIKALKIQRELYGVNHVEQAGTLQNYSYLMYAQKEYDEALEKQKENLNLQQDQIKSKFSSTLAASFKDIGETELVKGNFAEARKNLNESYQHFCHSLGQDDKKTQDTLTYYGRRILELGMEKQQQQQNIQGAFEYYHRSLKSFLLDTEEQTKFYFNDHTIHEEVNYFESTRLKVKSNALDNDIKCSHMLPAIKENTQTENFIGFRIIKKHPESIMRIGVMYNKPDQNLQLKSIEQIKQRKEEDDFIAIGEDEFIQGDIILCSIQQIFSKNQVNFENVNERILETSYRPVKNYLLKQDSPMYIVVIMSHPGDEIEVISNQMGDFMQEGLPYIIQNHLNIGKLNYDILLYSKARYHFTQALWGWLYAYKQCLFFFLKHQKTGSVYRNIIKELVKLKSYKIQDLYMLNDPINKLYSENIKSLYVRQNISKLTGFQKSMAPYDYFCYRLQIFHFIISQFNLFERTDIYDKMNDKLIICIQFFLLRTLLYYLDNFLANHQTNIFGVYNWIAVQKGKYKGKIIEQLKQDQHQYEREIKRCHDILISSEDATGVSYQDFVIGDNVEPYINIRPNKELVKDVIQTNKMHSSNYSEDIQEDEHIFINDMQYDVKLPFRYIALYTHNVFFEDAQFILESTGYHGKEAKRKALFKLRLSLLVLLSMFLNKIIDVQSCRIQLQCYHKQKIIRRKSINLEMFLKSGEYKTYLQSQLGNFQNWLERIDKYEIYEAMNEIYIQHINPNKPFFFDELHFPKTQYFKTYFESDSEGEEYDIHNQHHQIHSQNVIPSTTAPSSNNNLKPEGKKQSSQFQNKSQQLNQQNSNKFNQSQQSNSSHKKDTKGYVSLKSAHNLKK